MPRALNSGSSRLLGRLRLKGEIILPLDAGVVQLLRGNKGSNLGGSDCLAWACIVSAPSKQLFG